MSAVPGWDQIKQKLSVGSRVLVTVIRHEPFGFFVSIPDVPLDGLVKIHEVKDVGSVTPSEYPPVGSVVQTVVIGFHDKDQQVWLSMKPSLFK